MKNLNPEFCKSVKLARREAGLTQGQLAAEVGCKQSALSMFEQGDGTKLNDEVIEKLAKKFTLSLSPSVSPAQVN
ncbi:MAG: helix-turn-helix transcriptional regulator, partial [Kiritimatiellae bacterium]|nr:helix-turn-helix transcriptional regulator [Kiritimatiellia bacterium]